MSGPAPSTPPPLASRASQPLWLCLHLPALALEALGPWSPGLALPLLVGARDAQGARVVCQASMEARRRGVSIGQALATAQALAPDALVLDRRPDREAEALHRLALRLGTLTPHLVIASPDLLLEVRSCLRLFGGIRALRQRALQHVREAGLTPRSGLAFTPLAARLLARHGRNAQRHALKPGAARLRVQALPLEALPSVVDATVTAGPSTPSGRTARSSPSGKAPPPLGRTLDLLHALGLHTLGDLSRLPAAGLTRRGAGAWLDTLARAEGRRPDPQPWFEAPDTFRQTLSLSHPADTVERVALALDPLLQALCGWLHLHWHAAQRLELVLQHEHGARRHQPDERLVIDLAQPSRDARHLSTVLNERLQRHPLEAAVDGLQLNLLASMTAAGQALSLLPGHAPELAADHAALIDRLCARLGPDAVLRLHAQADARPEKAQRSTSAQTRAPSPSSHEAPPDLGRPRPTWLIDPPLPLEVQDDRPLLATQPLHLLTRAERIESGWHDGALVRRDYHVALAGDGTLHWIYREHPQRPQQLQEDHPADEASAPAEAEVPAVAAPHLTAQSHPAKEPLDISPRWFLHGHFG